MTTLMCLAMAVYFESRGEIATNPDAGYAVAEVVMNRVDSPRFPNSVCGVVQQQRGKSCQFSFWCDGTHNNMNDKVSKQWSMRIAKDVMRGVNTLGIKADHFHNTRVRPGWSKRMKFEGRVGSHLFYVHQ